MMQIDGYKYDDRGCKYRIIDTICMRVLNGLGFDFLFLYKMCNKFSTFGTNLVVGSELVHVSLLLISFSCFKIEEKTNLIKAEKIYQIGV